MIFYIKITTMKYFKDDLNVKWLWKTLRTTDILVKAFYSHISLLILNDCTLDKERTDVLDNCTINKERLNVLDDCTIDKKWTAFQNNCIDNERTDVLDNCTIDKERTDVLDNWTY